MFRRIFRALRGRGSKALESTRIGIKGIRNRGSVKTIKKALLSKSGVREVYFNHSESVATVYYDPTQTDVSMLTDVILRKGYFPTLVGEGQGEASFGG